MDDGKDVAGKTKAHRKRTMMTGGGGLTADEGNAITEGTKNQA
jgi:hypothetical protein